MIDRIISFDQKPWLNHGSIIIIVHSVVKWPEMNLSLAKLQYRQMQLLAKLGNEFQIELMLHDLQSK